ncbi:MAG: ABC transporter substrate-binding protein [Saprospiraceae bacterium]|nr:ABC transporter substrate-binding protein [Saprospiraceae bacterium]
MRYFTDQLQRSVALPVWPPRRIISLVPSQTEYLADLGLEEAVVGITKFCLHPRNWFEQKTRIGGTKTLNIPKIAALKPDLIIGNKEENEISQIHLLEKEFPVWMSDIITLEDALNMMMALGELTGKEDVAKRISANVKRAFNQLTLPQKLKRAAYLIWRKPYMVAAGHTFVHEMMAKAGFENVFGDLSRYPEVSEQMLAEANPEVLLLSSEPYPFKEKHLAALKELCPKADVVLVDGELFSWYGSRLLGSPAYFDRLYRQLHFGPLLSLPG